MWRKHSSSLRCGKQKIWKDLAACNNSGLITDTQDHSYADDVTGRETFWSERRGKITGFFSSLAFLVRRHTIELNHEHGGPHRAVLC